MAPNVQCDMVYFKLLESKHPLNISYEMNPNQSKLYLDSIVQIKLSLDVFNLQTMRYLTHQMRNGWGRHRVAHFKE